MHAPTSGAVTWARRQLPDQEAVMGITFWGVIISTMVAPMVAKAGEQKRPDMNRRTIKPPALLTTAQPIWVTMYKVNIKCIFADVRLWQFLIGVLRQGDQGHILERTLINLESR
ncbi:hypothetical protein C6P44_000783 [Monosporozyma unispora]|nr:hypothetical protein C6P44_000783 [Kazachstania unispora]